MQQRIWWPSKRPFGVVETAVYLLGAGVFGDSFGAFADCVLGKLSGQQQSNGSLDLSAADG